MMPEKSFDRTVLFGLIVLQVLLFSSFYLREVAWYPPDNFDQASYLIETYQLQERIFTHGLGQIWKYLWGPLRPRGGSAFPNRRRFGESSSAVAVAATRCAFSGSAVCRSPPFQSPREFRQRRAYGYIALGLILSDATLWFWKEAGCSISGWIS